MTRLEPATSLVLAATKWPSPHRLRPSVSERDTPSPNNNLGCLLVALCSPYESVTRDQAACRYIIIHGAKEQNLPYLHPTVSDEVRQDGFGDRGTLLRKQLWLSVPDRQQGIPQTTLGSVARRGEIGSGKRSGQSVQGENRTITVRKTDGRI